MRFFHNLFIFLTNNAIFSFIQLFIQWCGKNIQSTNLFIQKNTQNIHSINIFIQQKWKLFIQRKYSFKWKMDYRPGLYMLIDADWCSNKVQPGFFCRRVPLELLWSFFRFHRPSQFFCLYILFSAFLEYDALGSIRDYLWCQPCALCPWWVGII